MTIQSDVDDMLTVRSRTELSGVIFTFDDGATLLLQGDGLTHLQNEIGEVDDWSMVDRLPEGYYLIADRRDNADDSAIII